MLSSVNPSNMHCYLGADKKHTGEASGIELYRDAVTVVTVEVLSLKQLEAAASKGSNTKCTQQAYRMN